MILFIYLDRLIVFLKKMAKSKNERINSFDEVI